MSKLILPITTLLLGGARSGKSAFAEDLAVKSDLDRLYLATGRAYDQEMTDRIEKHQKGRGAGWTTLEAPLDIVTPLVENAASDRVILVDCLTLWITNLMMAENNIEEEMQKLLASLTTLKGPVLFVSNEVGQGIVPDNAMARAFRDHAGRLHQLIAAQADSVYFLTAGIPQKLK
ncbi:MAG: bifunctional adenosylcobinamide kinase/adenosylcobinamide-phosphate guanylyltransferase [Sneathiella sp.]|nr:bifunctional adenosylcobinamide kinase/adenosylcobinamide-phosphate guanylyltransferase [Sneathiella sp.]